MDAWAILMYGLYQQAAMKLGATNECLAKLRAEKVIR